jgi:glycosyltransferase involved in cell wall biosynthesis
MTLHAPSTRRIGVVVSTFPRPVDAYMLRELVALCERGLDIRIYSLRRPTGAAVPRAADGLRERTTYAPGPASPAVARAHGAFLRTGSARYRTALRTAITTHARSPRLLAKVLAVWPQTVFFARQAIRDRLDHVHANWATYPAAAAQSVSRLSGLPWSFAGHASDIYLEPTGLAAKIRDAAFVTTCTVESQRYLTRLAGDAAPGRVRTVYHGTDLSAFGGPRSESPDLHILAVGTLRECKGFDTLLKATARVRESGTPTRLTIVGDGEERTHLTRLTAQLGLEGHTTFTGYVAHDDMARLYRSATMLVLPARSATHFGIPNVIIEAQAASLPVVCTPLPALGELIEDGTSGLYVPEDDPERLASVIRSLSTDPARRRRIAAEALRRVTSLFDISRTASVLAELFGGTTSAAPRGVTADQPGRAVCGSAEPAPRQEAVG